MDETIRHKIIMAAIDSAGPVGDSPADWQKTVTEGAARITAMLSERSMVSRLIEAIDASKVFPATITRLQLEKSSQRALVTLATRPSEKNPDGVEVARTERVDGPLGAAIVERLKQAKGHKVLLWVELQQMSSSTNSVRIITHFEDLGVDESLADAEAA